MSKRKPLTKELNPPVTPLRHCFDEGSLIRYFEQEVQLRGSIAFPEILREAIEYSFHRGLEIPRVLPNEPVSALLYAVSKGMSEAILATRK